MPRTADIRKKGFIPIPKDMDRLSWKVIITDSNDVAHDVTSDLPRGSLTRIATDGLSSFSFDIDNTEGKYKDKFAAGDTVDIYYDFKSSSDTIKFRGLVDGAFDNVNGSVGWVISITGRDSPKSSTYEHFADTHITRTFAAMNNVDTWFGTTGTADSNENYPDGILYNSGMILKVYDTVSTSWKVYKDLTEEQKDTLKAQTGYTQTHTNTYVDKSRLTMSMEVAKEGNYDFRIYYDPDDGNTYFMVHPEDGIINPNEHISIGQNFLSLGRFGVDTAEEFNRIRETGFADGNILMMRTKQDTVRQSAMWIKDKEETTSALTSDDEIAAKASARLNKLKEAPNKGNLVCCGLPTLHPGEKIHVSIPYVITDYIKVKSFVVNFGTDIGLEFSIDLQDREIKFEKIFKDRIDENVSVTPSNNPNGMRDFFVWDFSDPDDYSLTDCQIEDGVLSLSPGVPEGICIIKTKMLDFNATQGELRIKANQYWNCTYEVSSDGGQNYQFISPGTYYFDATGASIALKINLKEPQSGVSPEFDKINLGVR